MNINNVFGKDDKKIGGYPSPFVSPSEKETKEYGLAYFKKMYHDWKDNSQLNIDSRKARYSKARSYAQGSQSISKYKDLLDVEGDTSYLNLDWTPVNIIPKFLDLIVNDLSNQEYEVVANAIDPLAETTRENDKKRLFAQMLTQPGLDKMGEVTGYDLSKKGYVPQSKEELDVHMLLNYKQATEIAMEKGIKFVLDLNDYDSIKKSIIRDMTVCGLGACKTMIDPNSSVKIKYVDPSNLITSYTNKESYDDIQHAGEVYTMTIGELKRIAGDQLSESDYEEIANEYLGKNNNETSPNYESSLNQYQNEHEHDKYRVTVLDAEFFSVNELKYEKKKNAYGGYSVRKKGSKYKTPKKSKFERELIKTSIKVVYSGKWIVGTDFIINYGLAKNMMRNKSNLTETKLSYIIYAPGTYKMINKSMVERMIPFADQIQLAHLKLQQVIAKARPKGAAFELGALENVTKGDGGVFSPLELQEIYDQTGNIYYRTTNDAGEPSGAVPVQELENGIGGDMQKLISIYSHNLQMIRDVTGVNEAREGAKPPSEALVGVQKLQIMASNNATRSINDGSLNMTKRISECVCMRVQDIISSKSKLQSYRNALGKTTMAMFDINKDVTLHEFGIILDVAPDEEERSQLEQNLQASLQQKEIRLEDVIMIRRIKNIKLANQVLMFRRKKYQEEEERKGKEAQKQNAEIQKQTSNQQSQLKQQEAQLMSEIEIQAIQMKSQSRIKELDAEYRLKDQLDAVQHKRRLAEIQLNNTGKVNVAGASGNVKLESQDKAAYNQSRMIEQKRDRALPLSQLETGPKKETPPAKEGEQAAPSNVENPLPEILK
tara:strand:+ start:501 stop:2990 length:2490 start_codon:yes stop_codon:yes gene_type:complete